MEGGAIPAAEFSRLNWRLGEIYADCIARTSDQLGRKPALIGLHGQTIHHETAPKRVLGSTVRSTWQLGEAAVVAERLRCPVVSDLRPADLAAGGQGAPLVPMLDWCLFRSPRLNRVLQNIGGIGNLTVIPAAVASTALIAFDTGPGNMVIDACTQRLFNKPFDRNGAIARRGSVLREVVAAILREPYFAAAPPKSCGREEYGAAFTERFLALCRTHHAADADIVATATALTAESTLHAYRTFVWPQLGQHAPLARTEFLVAGGGAKNGTLMAQLREGLGSLGVRLRSTDELGIPTQAKEAVAFALLAWLTWHRQPGNIPSATGASRPVILGKVSFG
jgi:anhydro-N-acetylmuramic acid kinase